MIESNPTENCLALVGVDMTSAAQSIRNLVETRAGLLGLGLPFLQIVVFFPEHLNPRRFASHFRSRV